MIYEIQEDTLNLEEMSVGINRWNVNSDSLPAHEAQTAVLVFGVDDRDIVVPSHVEYTCKVYDDGKKITIQTTDNGWLVIDGKKTHILTSHYGLADYIISRTMVEKTFELPLEDYEETPELETVLFKLNTHHKAQEVREAA